MKKYKVTGNLNLRSGPSKDFPPIAILKKGEVVEYQNISSGKWFKVKNSKHQEGYCSSNYLEEVKNDIKTTNVKQIYPSHVVAYFNRVVRPIQTLAKEYGYKYPSAIIAQSALESGWGKRWSCEVNNYFGIKYGKWIEKSVLKDKVSFVNTKTKEEYTPGSIITITDAFVKCKTFNDGMKLYFEFLKCNPRYNNLKSATSPEDYAKTIKEDKYATDSKYPEKIISILNKYNLKQYD